MHAPHQPCPVPTMFARSLLSRSLAFARPPAARAQAQQVRQRHQLAPKNTPYPKRHKGTIPVPTGGSTKGTTLAYGEWGIRIIGNGARISAKQLTTAEEVIKRKIKVIKGARVWLRVFPDIPVCIKVRAVAYVERRSVLTRGRVVQGNETRMGKGKGTFEFWATRCV
jgi:ribosomal protein L16